MDKAVHGLGRVPAEGDIVLMEHHGVGTYRTVVKQVYGGFIDFVIEKVTWQASPVPRSYAVNRKEGRTLTFSPQSVVHGYDSVSGNLWSFTAVDCSELSSPTASSAGCICKRCNSKNVYAAPNQKDGSYVCYECR